MTQPDTLPPVDLRGLTDAEAAARRSRGDGNDARLPTTRSYAQILRDNAFTFINTVLYGIALLLIALGLYGDALVTGGLVLINVVVGVAQEVRAKRTLDRLALLTRPTATVVREGERRTGDPREIVLGDLLVVGPGDQIVVDGRVVAGGRIEVDESLLTGEAELVPKDPGDPLLSGSFCVTGSATYVAERVGLHSFANELTVGARAYKQEKTPLQKDVDEVIRAMVVLVVLLALPVLFGLQRFFGTLPVDETVRAAAVLVALVPQGLSVMITVTYALGAVRIASGGALVQRPNAVESMSRVDTLCVDKTGTLTTNRIELLETVPVGLAADVITAVLGEVVASASSRNRTAEAIAVACPGPPRHVGEEVPFSSQWRWSGVALIDGTRPGTYLLGAPEVIGPALARDDARDGTVDQTVATRTGEGHRVLFVAEAPEGATLRDGDRPRLPVGLQLLAVLTFAEELRPDLGEIIAGFRAAGVALKVISGDNPRTVAALARRVGLGSDGAVASGLELAELGDAALAEVAGATAIFGRVNPALKARLVDALRQSGRYVAMIGDGVNDVLSLKRANLGIAMQSGSQATRGVADIVLMGDAFAALPPTVVEGQRIVSGMRTIIRLFLARTFAVTVIVVGAAFLGLAFPLTPKHNSVLALLTVGIPTLAIAVWAQPQQSPRHLLVDTLRFAVPAAIAMALVALPFYAWELADGRELEVARTELTTLTILCGLLLIPFAVPPTGAWTGGSRLSGDWRPTLLALGLLGLYVLFFLVPLTRDFFGLRHMPVADLAVIVVVALGWTVGLRFAWRATLFERVVGFIGGAWARRTFHLQDRSRG